MDTLQINTGTKRISVTRDGTAAGEIVFNPSDVMFAEKFYRLLSEFQNQFSAFQAESRALDQNKRTDENGLPINTEKRIDLLKESCQFSRDKIDVLFGAGTSQIAFGDALSMDAIKQFLEGMTPFIQSVRVNKVQKYTNKKKRTI